jgi:type VI secretion system ImpB/VipA family protein
MTKPADSQKFLARNRAPRVQIEYEVEAYGADKKVELPFVMAVMADLSGQSEVAKPPVEQRKFLDISVDNFDARMAAMQPRVALQVPNTLTNEGQLPVELRFQKLADFSPAAIATQVEPLRRLLEVRECLSNLLTFMDGKIEAEHAVTALLKDPQRMAALRALRANLDDSNEGEQR